MQDKIYKNYSLPFRPKGGRKAGSEGEGKKADEKEWIAVEL